MLASKYHVSTDSGQAILFYWRVLLISMVYTYLPKFLVLYLFYLFVCTRVCLCACVRACVYGVSQACNLFWTRYCVIRIKYLLRDFVQFVSIELL